MQRPPDPQPGHWPHERHKDRSPQRLLCVVESNAHLRTCTYSPERIADPRLAPVAELSTSVPPHRAPCRRAHPVALRHLFSPSSFSEPVHRWLAILLCDRCARSGACLTSSTRTLGVGSSGLHSHTGKERRCTTSI